ncbi:MAG: MetQ/NlpA family ABC transporter substrate-binding protein [Anaerolineae bacterium]
MRSVRFYAALLTLIAATLLLAACSGEAAQPAPPAEEAVEEGGTVSPVRMALLPVLDTLPFYIAQENGYFEELGLEVIAVPVASPVERDQLMQAGEVDGMLNEITSTAVFNRDGLRVKTVLAARIATEDGPVFRLLASPASDISGPADLAGVPIGVSQNTVIEYVTDRMLQEEGLPPDQIVTQSVPVIPERFQLLMQGDLLAATLPDPLAQAALQAGAKPVIDDSAYPFYSLSTLTFSIEAIEGNPEGVRRFIAAWEKAVADLNADPEAYRALFLEKVNVPESVQETYQIPPFPVSQVPSAEQWADVMDWLIGKGLLESPVSYEDSVTTEFLP